ncbi:MAG: peptidoglycan-binding protein [Micavibrio sp.]|nr:peptidoglycan-binding protein [Micavibrio sp.]
MRLFRPISTAIFCALALTACGKSNTPAPVLNYGTHAKDSAGIHVVQKGDTVHSIANRYKVSMRALINKNDLSAPYIINLYERLILPPPNTYTVRRGDSLYTISRAFGVDMSRLSRTNNLRAPYKIYPGDVLRIPDGGEMNTTGNTRVASTPVSKATPKPSAASKPVPKSVQVAPPPSNGPFAWPVRGKVLSSYGPKADGLHNDGINIAARKGEPVKAAQNGVVAYVGDQIQGFGNLILLRHEDRYMSAYGHLDKISVTKGQVVQKGQAIGQAGMTGNVDTPQLHFEIRRGTKALNPQKYL